MQEERLIRVIREHKTTIGWTIVDIKGISPSMCMHRILLEEGVIYPISDSKWMGPVQVVPKKSSVTVVKNNENELVPTRVQIGLRVCIDYRYN